MVTSKNSKVVVNKNSKSSNASNYKPQSINKTSSVNASKAPVAKNNGKTDKTT